MYPEYYSVCKGGSKQEETNNESLSNKTDLTSEKTDVKVTDINEENMDKLADRTLLLLSFKDTSTQNLRYVFNVLGIRTIEEKNNILQEIYRLIRAGIIYVPRGLPQLIDQGLRLDVDNSLDTENIHLCLLRSHEEVIKEIQSEINELNVMKPVKKP